MTLRDHGDPGDAPSIPPPLGDLVNPVRPSAAEEARTIAASTNTATLASLSADGSPWASLITYGLLGGDPVLCVSHMAEHGRNLAGDPRTSISVVAPSSDGDPLAHARITLAGTVFAPDDDLPLVASVTPLWTSANWFEREAFDLFGIVFDGHNDIVLKIAAAGDKRDRLWLHGEGAGHLDLPRMLAEIERLLPGRGA